MLCGLALLGHEPAMGAERLAVLELSGELPPQELGLLTDEVRGAVVDAVGADVAVMTRENMEVMLTDMGIDASCVSEGACEVETARNLGVDYVVSGAVVSMGGKQIASLKLHQTKNAQLLASKRAQGEDALGLLDEIGDTAGQLVATISAAATLPAEPAAKPTPTPSAQAYASPVHYDIYYKCEKMGVRFYEDGKVTSGVLPARRAAQTEALAEMHAARSSGANYALSGPNTVYWRSNGSTFYLRFDRGRVAYSASSGGGESDGVPCARTSLP